jgi:hypothetical protein
LYPYTKEPRVLENPKLRKIFFEAPGIMKRYKIPPPAPPTSIEICEDTHSQNLVV